MSQLMNSMHLKKNMSDFPKRNLPCRESNLASHLEVTLATSGVQNIN